MNQPLQRVAHPEEDSFDAYVRHIEEHGSNHYVKGGQHVIIEADEEKSCAETNVLWFQTSAEAYHFVANYALLLHVNFDEMKELDDFWTLVNQLHQESVPLTEAFKILKQKEPNFLHDYYTLDAFVEITTRHLASAHYRYDDFPPKETPGSTKTKSK